jgi:hypothetical protein
MMYARELDPATISGKSLSFKRSCVFIFLLLLWFFWFGFYNTLTHFRTHDDLPALQLEEDFRCSFMHYIRYKHAPEYNHQRSVNLLDSCLTWKNPKSLTEFEHKGARFKWFEVKDLNHSATDSPKKSW